MASEQLTIQSAEPEPGLRVITLTGPLTLSTMFGFQTDIRREASDSIVVDLAGVPYMDSAGLGCLLGAMASCQRSHRGFALAGVSERVLTVFEVTGVENLVPMYPSVDAATAALKAKTAGAPSGS
ncbi:MAG TPA: STAS domain-containing protein [Bryobacteraceae bacterium]|nr:STAS domain-containing protein [Bryobacteraceae bacterium]